MLGIIESYPHTWSKIQTHVLLPRRIIHQSHRFLSYNSTVHECQQSRKLIDDLLHEFKGIIQNFKFIGSR